MKVSALIISAIVSTGPMLLAAPGYGQGSERTVISVDFKNIPVPKAFSAIEAKANVVIMYENTGSLRNERVTLVAKDKTVADILDELLKDKGLRWSARENVIRVEAEASLQDKRLFASGHTDQAVFPAVNYIDVHGRVVNEKGEPVAGATVTVKGTRNATATDDNGEFALKDVDENATLVISGVNVETREVKINGESMMTIKVATSISNLDQVVVMAYGQTTKRLNTGSIGKVTSEEIAQQPVSDPLATLHGKVPGLVVTQSSGMPGGSISIQVRGQNSLAQGSVPLIIVDGVPLAANNQNINLQYSIITTGGSAGLSPMASVNPLDIESIEILKDADATAIYGSRGANGVVLITTKKGSSGRTRVFVNFYTGWSKASKLPEMLNTQEYVEMRKEAIANDGFVPNNNPSQPGYAPDLFRWDTTRYTNFSKMMLGNTAHTYNSQVGLSGGNKNIQLFFSAGYNKEGTVFPGNMGSDKISFTNNISYTSRDKKFTAKLASSYSNAKNNLFNASIGDILPIPPNAPPLYTVDGKLNWEEGGYYFANPLSYLKQKYNAVTDNLLANLQVEYKIAKGLSVRGNFGYNSMQVSEKIINPIAAQIAIYDPVGTLSISDNFFKNWIIEPQAEYETMIGKGRLDMLIGSTFSQNRQDALSVSGEGYKSDNLLNSLSAATSIYASNFFSDYKYAALFGRVNYNWDQKYILNLTGRRDGSSRFGPDKQFANFGAVGAAWLFGEEHFMQKLLPFISYAKLRTSYGLTGNDQIGNYKYLDTWTPYYDNYQGGSALYPTALFNPLYGWETNRKFEAALELGLFKDRIYLSSAYFNNRCGNQLIDYTLAFQTGFSSIISNFPALVQNNGFEFQLIAIPIQSKYFKWSVSANISIPSNKLLRFDGLSTSAYSFSYVEGKSLSVIYKLNYLGVNPATGVFGFEDLDKDNVISIPNDFVVKGNTDPKYYGGIRNTFTFKKIELDLFVDFKKQTGINYLNFLYSKPKIPGFAGANQPKYALDRWQKTSDVSEVLKFTSIRYSDVNAAKEMFRYYSNGIYGDASFIRLKTASISWQLPSTILRAIKTSGSKIFLTGQNLFTISNYKGTDPEIQNYSALSTLKTIVVGINLNF